MKILLLNNLRVFFKDKRAVVLTFLLPIALTSLFMMVFGGSSNSGGQRGMSEFEIGVCDLIANNASQKTVADLDSSKSFMVEPINDSALLVDKVQKGNLNAGVIIYWVNKKQSYKLILDGAREVENAMLRPQLSMLLMGGNNSGMKDMIAEKIKKDFPDFSDSDRVIFDKQFESFSGDFDIEKLGGGNMQTQVLKPDNGVNPGAIQAIAGTALMTLLFAVAGMGASIIEEKEKGTLRRILLSPINPLDFMLAKYFAAIIVSVLQLSITLVFCWVVFNFPIFTRPLELLLLILLTSAACAAFGILLAGIADSRKQIESLSTIVVLLMSLLGGSMIPSFIMPPVMQKFSMITINYWASDGFFDLFYRNVEFSHFALKLGVLLLFSVVLISISIVLFRKKLHKIS